MQTRGAVLLLCSIELLGCAGHLPTPTPVVEQAYGTDVTLLPAVVRFGSAPGDVSLTLRSPVYLTALELTTRQDAFRVVYSSPQDAAQPLTGYVDSAINASVGVTRAGEPERRGWNSSTEGALDCRSMQQPTDRPDTFFNSDCRGGTRWYFKRTVVLVATSSPWRPGSESGSANWLATLAAPPGVTGAWAVMPLTPTAKLATFVVRTR
jgi:hypothetical protein